MLYGQQITEAYSDKAMLYGQQITEAYSELFKHLKWSCKSLNIFTESSIFIVCTNRAKICLNMLSQREKNL